MSRPSTAGRTRPTVSDTSIRRADGVYEVELSDGLVANVKVTVLLPPTARDVWVKFSGGPLVDHSGEERDGH